MLPGVTRRRLSILLLLVLLAFPAAMSATAVAQEEAQIPADRQPAVVLDEGGATQEEEAWTFRFLVPTVLAVSALALAGTVLAYGSRVRGRYRVVR